MIKNLKDMNEAELEEQSDLLWDFENDDLDPADPMMVISIIADHLDLNLPEILENLLRGNYYRYGEESMIQDIILESQSNLDRSLLTMLRSAKIEEAQGNL